MRLAPLDHGSAVVPFDDILFRLSDDLAAWEEGEIYDAGHDYPSINAAATLIVQRLQNWQFKSLAQASAELGKPVEYFAPIVESVSQNTGIIQSGMKAASYKVIDSIARELEANFKKNKTESIEELKQQFFPMYFSQST
jgi:hypothetical protein